MHISHVALWTHHLEKQVSFWQTYFSGVPNEKYISVNNPGFASYFIRLADGPTIELMTKPGLNPQHQTNNTLGWVHVAISVGSAEKVDAIAHIAEQNGILAGKPRTTGDGFYEAIITDPDGNLIEIVC